MTAGSMTADDFALILALWSGELQETELPVVLTTALLSGGLAVGVSQFGVAGLVGKAAGETAKAATIAVGQKLGAKGGVKGGVKGAGKLAGKIAEKAATKIATKFTVKLTAKGVAGFLPFVGPIIGGGINAYFVKDIADSANIYYAAKKASSADCPPFEPSRGDRYEHTAHRTFRRLQASAHTGRDAGQCPPARRDSGGRAGAQHYRCR